MTKETICACALNRVFGYEPRISLRLVQELGSAEAVFDLSPEEIDGLLGPYSKYRGQIRREMLEKEEKELALLGENGCRFLPYTSPDYPGMLRECEDPPAGLYVKCTGDMSAVFNSRPAVAVVGTRDMSPYGREWCVKIVDALSQAPAKPAIVSGLAFGVDITAHMAALGYGLPTIAVLPNGIETVYPSAHRVAAAKIASSPGSALVTDYPPGTGPVAFTFIRRNRIIAALSGTTILVESKARGGGLITARLASSYGREVLALPGRLDDPRSAGCNALIGEKTAEPVVNLRDLGEQAGLGRFNLRKKKDFMARTGQLYRNLPDGERLPLLNAARAIKENRGITAEELCPVLGLPYSAVSALTCTLESDGVIHTDLLGRCTINDKND